jgi:uncharacterized protein (TIGR03083 family)
MRFDLLREQTKTFAETVRNVDPGKQVPTCPEWSLQVLTGHIGQAHRWAARIVRTGAAAPVPDPRQANPPEDWETWLLEGADELVRAVEAASDEPVWTFLGPQPAMFWLRRMLVDTTVHYADAAITAGVPYEIPRAVALDAIAEGLGMLSAPAVTAIKPEVAELRGTGQTLQFVAGNKGWLVTRTPDGIRWEQATATADVTVTASAQDLLLFFAGRLSPDDVTITGDHELIAHWRARTAF